MPIAIRSFDEQNMHHGVDISTPNNADGGPEGDNHADNDEDDEVQRQGHAQRSAEKTRSEGGSSDVMSKVMHDTSTNPGGVYRYHMRTPSWYPSRQREREGHGCAGPSENVEEVGAGR